MTEKYFVLSNGDEPLQIFFTLENAQDYGNNGDYIDSFDENGKRVDSWKCLNDDEWTQEF